MGDQYTYIAWFKFDKPYRGRGIANSLAMTTLNVCSSDTLTIVYASPGLECLYPRFGFQTIRNSYRYLGRPFVINICLNAQLKLQMIKVFFFILTLLQQ